MCQTCNAYEALFRDVVERTNPIIARISAQGNHPSQEDLAQILLEFGLMLHGIVLAKLDSCVSMPAPPG